MELGMPPSIYSLDGNIINGIVLDKMIESDWYRVFYLDERGNYREEKYFDSEDKACNYMYELILSEFKLYSKEERDKYRNDYFKNS